MIKTLNIYISLFVLILESRMMKHTLFICLISFLLLIPISLRAYPVISKYNLPDLSNNAVLCMYQDSDDYLWIGTYDGLNLFNGKDSYVYRFDIDNPKSLCSNIIHKITEADPGYLWICTSLGINKFSLDQRRVVESYPGYLECELIASDSKGNTLAVSKDGFISCYSHNSDGFRDMPYEDYKPSSVKCLFSEEENVFQMVMSSGKIKIIKTKFNINDFALLFTEKTIHDQNILYAFVEEDHLFFVDESEQLYKYNLHSENKVFLRDLSGLIQKYGIIFNIQTFMSDVKVFFRNGYYCDVSTGKIIGSGLGNFCTLKSRSQDVLWIGSDGHGVLQYYDKQDFFREIMQNQLPLRVMNPIRGLFTDKYKNLWIGTKGDGLIRISEYDKYERNIPAHAVSHFTVSSGLSHNRVFCFKQSRDSSKFWIGTEGPGISYYSYKDNRVYTIRPPKGEDEINFVHGIEEISDSVLWLATTGKGLQEVHLKNLKTNPEITKVNTYFTKVKDNLCNEFQSICYDGDSLLYGGSRGGYGLVIMNVYRKTIKFARKNNEDHSPIGDILSICKVSDSLLYMGSSSGMNKLSKKKGKISFLNHYNKNEGIVNDMIHGILEDSNHRLWLSSNKGLIKFNPENNFFHSYTNPYLNVIEFSDDSYWKCPYTGRLFFGGVNGLVWINPSGVQKTETIVPRKLKFFEVKLDDKSYPVDKTILEKGIVMPHNTHHIQISFAIPDYINSENYEFAYFLENFNTKWVELQRNNKINISWLPYGKYKLKVRYRTGVSDYIGDEYVLPITVLPPWYLTNYAIITYCLLILLSFVLLRYLYLRQLRKKQQSLVLAMSEEQKGKLYEAKLKFFTQITHDLCTPLTMIAGVEDFIQKYSVVNSDSKLSFYSQVLKKNVEELNQLIQEVFNLKNIEEIGIKELELTKTSISSFMKQECKRFKELAEKKNIHFNLSVDDDLIWNTDVILVKTIFSNLLTYAFRQTLEGGEIKVAAVIENEALKFSVLNSGMSIPKEDIKYITDHHYLMKERISLDEKEMYNHPGLGLFICYNLVQLLKGNIQIDSDGNSYTKFIVTLPNYQMELPVQEEAVSSTAENNSLKGKSLVLVVDDHKDITWLISDILSSDYNVHVSESASEALTFLKQETPAALITDMTLIDMDGLEFVSNLKRNKYMGHIPVLAISSILTAEQQAQGLKMGVDAFLTKPFSPVVLKSIVYRLVSNQEQMKEYFYSPESAFQYIGGQLVHQEDKEFLEKVTAVISENISMEGLRPDYIAEKLNMNPRTLYRRLKKVINMTPSDYIKDYKLSYVARLLVTTNMNVQEILYQIGNTNKSYFYKDFAKRYNMTPSEYRKMNKKS